MQPVTSRRVVRFRDGVSIEADDHLAREEPLEIRLDWDEDGKRRQRSLSITMRTPGDDLALALGFLWTEGLIRAPADVAEARHCGVRPGQTTSHVVKVTLADGVPVALDRLERHFYTSSSCGVCGKSSLEAVATVGAPTIGPGPRLHPDLLPDLPRRLGAAQAVFATTGGLHAAGCFDAAGSLVSAHEDVGRHNAVDKLVGAALRDHRLPLTDHLLLVSGRASFELVQKALMAGVPVLAAVGAPSSLAVELAEAHGMTVIGFLRDGGFNVYCGSERVRS